ncbi:MAG: putative serine protease PepD [Actinomycetota bacterium]|jgi:putative serine protease PepD|nr:putative serine protease PepD [Actinomycetota bacterium]
MTEDTRTIPSYRSDLYPADGTVRQEPLPGFDPGQPGFPPPPPQGPPDPRRRRGGTTLVAVALAAGLLGGGVGAAVTTQLDDPASSTTASALDVPAPSGAGNANAGAVEQVAAKLLPSVVSIEERNAGGGGEGTGVILSADGLILTNNHVVAGAANGGSLSVTLNDGSTAAATIVGRDPVTDLAVIQATGLKGLTPATLGSSSGLKPGEGVVAIGSPLGLQGSVTSGIVSALDRPVRTGGDSAAGDPTSTVIDAIQTDAAINPGNSGGPLVNLSGEVVGINSAIASLGSGSGQSGSIGLGFAIPVDQARQIAQQLVKNGRATHAQLGVSVSDATNGGQAAGSGAGIAAVTAGGSAASAGLRAGDVVTKVGDRRVDGADALIAAIRSHRPGDKVTLTYERGGRSSEATVTLGNDAPRT